MTRPTKLIRLHVSASARGKADGSAAHPYPTLEAARDALRQRRRRSRLTAPVQVFVAPGVYRLKKTLVFTPEDGGTAQCPVTWTGDGGRPLLSGARVITGWRAGTINGRPCWQAVLPQVASGKWWFTQLFVNGRRRLRTRLPKQGFYRFTGVPEEEAKKDLGVLYHGAMSACFAPGQIRNFRNLADIDVVVPDLWRENHLRIASVDEAAHAIYFSTKGWSRFTSDETGQPTRFRLDHVAEGCTEPGDWYLDRPTGTLSYIPLPEEPMDTTQVEAPALESLLIIQGDALDPAKRVHHLRFEFLDLRHADWELPREDPGSSQAAFEVPAAVRFVGAEDCALYGCQVSQVAAWGVDVWRGCHRNRIVACALHDLGGGGIKIGHKGLGPLMLGRDTGASSAMTVSDCSIHNGGIIFHSAVGICIGDASRSRIVHNHIWNFTYSGISCGWNWGFAPNFGYDNRIESNHVHDIGQGLLSDMGAIYILGPQAGSTISRNYLHDVISYAYGGWGIYLDEGTSWMQIEQNVVCSTKCGAFHQHYGRDNLIRQNVFVDAIENQIKITRREMMRSAVFEHNLVQGAGSGALWQGDGWATAAIDGNVYAGDPGRPMVFGGKNWNEWQATGRDLKGRIMDAVLLDANGAAPAVANLSAMKAAGIDPEVVAAVITEAGPRFRSTLPSSIDAIRPEPEQRRPIIESRLWPWKAEWPGTHPWSTLSRYASIAVEERQAISLTLENRGDATAHGRYRLQVVPAGAARITGPTELKVALRPGARTALEAIVTPTGKTNTFNIEAVADGPDLIASGLFYSIVPQLKIRRLATTPALADLADALNGLPAYPVAGNGCPVKATMRVAVANDRLLVQVTTEDATPSRGANLWDGSSIELFTAPQCGAAHKQLVAAPPVGREAAAVCLATPSGPTQPTGVEVTGATTKTGWTLVLSLPLTVLGLDSATTAFALDLVINATRRGASKPCRTYLAAETNPFFASSADYARVAIVGKSEEDARPAKPATSRRSSGGKK